MNVDAIIAFKREQGWLASEEDEANAPRRAAEMKADSIRRHFEAFGTTLGQKMGGKHVAPVAHAAVTGAGVGRYQRKTKLRQMKQAGATRKERRVVRKQMKQQRKEIARGHFQV